MGLEQIVVAVLPCLQQLNGPSEPGKTNGASLTWACAFHSEIGIAADVSVIIAKPALS
jgi:hypothetical protein